MSVNNQFVSLERQNFILETDLQSLIGKHHELLAGDAINPATPRRWLLVAQEYPLNDGDGGALSVDHLFLDQDGVPTLVEVKRASNRELRREVVAQMMDYAAGLMRCDVRDIRQRFERRHASVDEAQRELESYLAGESDAETFWQRVSANLDGEKVRLLFVADEIPVTLRTIIEFLNDQMRTAEVLGVEIRRYGREGQWAYVPSVVGLTTLSQTRKAVSLPASDGTLGSFRAALLTGKRATQEAASNLDLLLAWIAARHLDFRVTPTNTLIVALDCNMEGDRDIDACVGFKVFRDGPVVFFLDRKPLNLKVGRVAEQRAKLAQCMGVPEIPEGLRAVGFGDIRLENMSRFVQILENIWQDCDNKA